MDRRLGWVWWTLSFVVAAWLLWMTFRPNQTVAGDLAPLTESAADRGIPAYLLIDLAGNIAVFVPLGVTLAMALGGRSMWRRLLMATFGGAAFSLAVELFQMTIPSRVSALDDWLLNTAGTFLGALAVCAIARRNSRSVQ